MKNTSDIKGFFVWFLIVSILFVLVFTITIVLTQNGFLYNTVNSVLGGERRYLASGDPSKYRYYEADYENKEEVLEAAYALNEEICAEGSVLLKNEGDALPLDKGSKITVFGKSSANLVLGGSGSNAGSLSDAKTDIYSGLEAAGFQCNPETKSYYESSASGSFRPKAPTMGTILTGFPICEAPANGYIGLRSSYTTYGDAAVAVISRTGGEGYDLPRTMFWDGSGYGNWKGSQVIPGARSANDHYLQLDANESAMLDEACAYFDKVIVVINSASPIELGFLDDPSHYAYNEKIKAALWIGNPGVNGTTAIGRVLCGEINPSGRLVDTYARDFRKDPSWHNFGNYLSEGGNRYTLNGELRNAYFVEYREGIYVGYRYYETRAAEELAADNETEWYDENVVFPFGFGKSYTDFEWTVTPSAENTETLTADGRLSFDVEVTNIGTQYDGKDVVQLYYSAPYNGKIEKAHVVLGDFAKTDNLKKNGGKGKVTLSVDVRDMASYDYADRNGNGIKGYELDAGEYTVYVSKDSHGWVDADTARFVFTVPEGGFVYPTADGNENTSVVNLFDDVSDHIGEYLSRKDRFLNFDVLTGASDSAHREVSQEFINSLTYRIDDKSIDPWYADYPPLQQKHELSYKNAAVKLYDLIDKPYDDSLWETLLDQLTAEQMKILISTGNYRTLKIENIGKPETIDADGPMGFAIFTGDGSIYDVCYYAGECTLAATFNKQLAYEMGRMVGNEGLIGNEKGDGRPYSGWYAPAVNIHRSPFGGRNFEYYSEDGLLSGEIGAAVVKGANEKGIYTFVKHFALNEQETNRDTSGLVTWANEQAMRELYFKPFEICVTDGKTTAMMSSFNRIGGTWAGGSYNLLTRLLRDEWGFEGTVITDFNLKPYMNIDQMIRAGGDLNLSPNKKPSSDSTATDVTAMRRAAKNILYTVANSSAMNGSGKDVIWAYAPPWWMIWLIILDCVVFAVAAALGTLYFVRRHREREDRVYNKYKHSASNEEMKK